MRAPSRTGDLTARVDQLIQQRQEHTEAVERIDATISEIERLLGATGSVPRRRGRPPGRPPAMDAGAVVVSGGRRGKRTRGRFTISGEESIINFVKSNRNPTTQDVKRHWASEGRGGTADNALSKLVRERKLKRIPLVGQRGSRYSV